MYSIVNYTGDLAAPSSEQEQSTATLTTQFPSCDELSRPPAPEEPKKKHSLHNLLHRARVKVHARPHLRSKKVRDTSSASEGVLSRAPASGLAPNLRASSLHSAQLGGSKSPGPSNSFAHETIRQKVLKVSQVILEIMTNIELSVEDEDRACADLQYTLSQLYERPEASVMVILHGSTKMRFGQRDRNTYLAKLSGVFESDDAYGNRKGTAYIQGALENILGIPAERGIVKFESLNEDALGSGGLTVAQEIINKARDSEEKTAGLVRPLSLIFGARRQTKSEIRPKPSGLAHEVGEATLGIPTPRRGGYLRHTEAPEYGLRPKTSWRESGSCEAGPSRSAQKNFSLPEMSPQEQQEDCNGDNMPLHNKSEDVKGKGKAEPCVGWAHNRQGQWKRASQILSTPQETDLANERSIMELPAAPWTSPYTYPMGFMSVDAMLQRLNSEREKGTASYKAREADSRPISSVDGANIDHEIVGRFPAVCPPRATVASESSSNYDRYGSIFSQSTDADAVSGENNGRSSFNGRPLSTALFQVVIDDARERTEIAHADEAPAEAGAGASVDAPVSALTSTFRRAKTVLRVQGRQRGPNRLAKRSATVCASTRAHGMSDSDSTLIAAQSALASSESPNSKTIRHHRSLSQMVRRATTLRSSKGKGKEIETAAAEQQA